MSKSQPTNMAKSQPLHPLRMVKSPSPRMAKSRRLRMVESLFPRMAKPRPLCMVESLFPRMAKPRPLCMVESLSSRMAKSRPPGRTTLFSLKYLYNDESKLRELATFKTPKEPVSIKLYGDGIELDSELLKKNQFTLEVKCPLMDLASKQTVEVVWKVDDESTCSDLQKRVYQLFLPPEIKMWTGISLGEDNPSGESGEDDELSRIERMMIIIE
ncbi:hypothetical protein EC957_009431 [Mortierella hygrophila]|uniref:Uncharacterized protein n=1 Tax=Mortierella hygrophila TaxID=979708 RepID=A0A9P6JXS8_9FUNG|nr:hypothetical protein EC957_009431 [Mortierella hygrophila]